jgi:hypothetical protein
MAVEVCMVEAIAIGLEAIDTGSLAGALAGLDQVDCSCTNVLPTQDERISQP